MMRKGTCLVMAVTVLLVAASMLWIGTSSARADSPISYVVGDAPTAASAQFVSFSPLAPEPEAKASVNVPTAIRVCAANSTPAVRSATGPGLSKNPGIELVPEPSTFGFLAFGIVGALPFLRRRKRA